MPLPHTPNTQGGGCSMSGYFSRYDGREIVAVCGPESDRFFVGPWSIEGAERTLQSYRESAWGAAEKGDVRDATLHLKMANELADALADAARIRADLDARMAA